MPPVSIIRDPSAPTEEETAPDVSLPAAALAAAPIFNEFLTIVRSGAPYYC